MRSDNLYLRLWRRRSDRCCSSGLWRRVGSQAAATYRGNILPPPSKLSRLLSSNYRREYLEGRNENYQEIEIKKLSCEMCHDIFATEDTAETIYVHILFIFSIFFFSANSTFEEKYITFIFDFCPFFITSLIERRSKYFWKVGKLVPDYTALQSRSRPSLDFTAVRTWDPT